MKSRLSIKEIVLGGFFLIYTILLYLMNPSFSYYVPVIFGLLILILITVFELKNYYKKNFLFAVVTVLLAAMWIISYQCISPSVNRIIYFVVLILVTLGIIVAIKIDLLPRWDEDEKALDSYDKALAIDPSDTITLNKMGIELRRQGKNVKALKCFDKVIEINSTDTTALNNKGVELVGMKRYGKAIEYFDKVLEIYPDDAAALYNKGVLLDKKRKYREGKDYLDKALELDPGLKIAAKSGKLILETARSDKKYQLKK